MEEITFRSAISDLLRTEELKKVAHLSIKRPMIAFFEGSLRSVSYDVSLLNANHLYRGEDVWKENIALSSKVCMLNPKAREIVTNKQTKWQIVPFSRIASWFFREFEISTEATAKNGYSKALLEKHPFSISVKRSSAEFANSRRCEYEDFQQGRRWTFVVGSLKIR